MRIKTELRATPQVLNCSTISFSKQLEIKITLPDPLFKQWSMFKINELETLDTAFYRCEASNAVESVHSDAIVQVGSLTNSRPTR